MSHSPDSCLLAPVGFAHVPGMRWPRGASFAIGILAGALVCAPARAAEAETPSSWRAGAAALFDNTGGGLALDGRYRFGSGAQLGLMGSGRALSKAYFGGQKVEGAAAGQADALLLVPLRRAALELDLRLTSGLRYAADLGDDSLAPDDAWRSVTELGCIAHVRLGARQLLRAGVILGFELELQPTQELADQTQLLSLGWGHAITPSTLLYGQVDAGGAYGFDGDNGKALIRGAFGLRLSFGGDAREGF